MSVHRFSFQRAAILRRLQASSSRPSARMTLGTLHLRIHIRGDPFREGVVTDFAIMHPRGTALGKSNIAKLQGRSF